MIWLHETHEVVGLRELEFEALYRDEWLPRLAQGDQARLLYFAHHAHGSGVSYNVVTLTAIRDGAAWEHLVQRVDRGDLAELARRTDGLRHDVTAKLLIPLPWSPVQQLDLASIPTAPQAHELSLFMEDTMWPYEGKLEDYIQGSGAHYFEEMKRPNQLLAIQASFRTAFGSHRRREVVFWQKLLQPGGLERLLRSEIPEEMRKPGSWMHDGLQLRDRWQSRLLRTSSWSPCY
jgi:hypothetical protein